ncbi:MAG: hypothetical protein ACKO5E_22840 [bacterium]
MTFWPAPLTISDFRAVMISPWLSRNFRIRPLVIVPGAHQFVHEMKQRKSENRSVIRLENLELLVEANPSLTKIPFNELLDLRHSSEEFAAVYAILTNFFSACTKNDLSIIRVSYEDLYSSPHQTLEYLIDVTGMRQKKEIGEAMKAIRISYDGSNYQKIPHSPKDPTAWKTGLHDGQIGVINEVLKEMGCPDEGITSWRAAGPDSDSKLRVSARSSARSRKSGSSRREKPPASASDINGQARLADSASDTQSDSQRRQKSSESHRKSRSSSSGKSRSSARSQRRDRNRNSEDLDY